MTVRLEGLEKLEAALAEVASQSTRVAITRRALTKAAEPMRAMAAQYAPVATGELSDSIKISTRAVGEVGRAAYAATVKGTYDAAKEAGVAWNEAEARASGVSAMRAARRAFKAINPPAILYLGPTRNVWYAHFVEFGTKAHINAGKFAGSKHPGTSPDPFLRPAFDAEAQGTIDRLSALVWDEIQRHATRMAARAAKAKG